PLGDQRLRSAEPIEHVERRRMKGRGARLLAQIRPSLEHHYRHAAADEVGSRHEADRPRACNQHPLLDRHDASGWIKSGAGFRRKTAPAPPGPFPPATSLRRRSLPTGDFGIALTKT